jgi:hypothetical protein
MKKTNKMATIAQPNYHTGNYVHAERRVFEDDNGEYFVRINGSFISIDRLISLGDKVNIWF